MFGQLEDTYFAAADAAIAPAATPPRPPLSYKEEMAALRRVREARLAFGIRAAQRAWIDSGLPIYDGMVPPDQGEMSLTPPAGGGIERRPNDLCSPDWGSISS